MRIAIVAPLFETVPPTAYGGTERVLDTLIEELIKQHHHVTLYSVGGSHTRADLVATLPSSLFATGAGISEMDIMPSFTAQLRCALDDLAAGSYDIVHVHHEIRIFHGGFFNALLHIAKYMPILWTDHVNLNVDFKRPVFECLKRAGIRFTALSETHRALAPQDLGLNITTVYNGIPENLLRPTSSAPSYVAFLGRLAPEKGAPAAIRIAAAAGLPMKLAGPMNNVFTRSAAYADDLRAQIAANNIDYVGEINDQQKSAFMSGALALLFPIQWDEPFGLVVIEAMACGTPVIAFRRGAVPELVEDGVTGFIVDTEEEAVQKLKVVGVLDRREIRRCFERRFTARRMAEGYLRLYEVVVREKRKERRLRDLLEGGKGEEEEGEHVDSGVDV